MAKTLTNLRALTRAFALGDSTSTAFSDTDTLLFLNSRYQDTFLMATANDGEFEFNGDGSQSINITSATRQYALATDLFKVSRVEIKYPTTATDYIQANAIQAGQIQYTGKANYTASPFEFDLMGDYIEIFVSAKTADILAVTSGIKIYYQKELTELSAGGDEIIFPDVFSRYIALGAAKDYCGVNSLNGRLQWIESELQKAEPKLIEFIASRNKSKVMGLRTRRENYGAGGGNYVSDKSAF